MHIVLTHCHVRIEITVSDLKAISDFTIHSSLESLRLRVYDHNNAIHLRNNTQLALGYAGFYNE